MNAIQRQTLLNLTENLFEAIDQTESIITQTRDVAKVRAEFDTLHETIDRYIPPDEPSALGVSSTTTTVGDAAALDDSYLPPALKG